MSVPSQAHPQLVRFSRRLLACALRYWPEETRPWGVALAAEIDETNGAFESLLWLWGGIMLFARSVMGRVLAWLRLPAGAHSAGSGPVGPATLPRRSRLLTAGLLIAAVVVLMSPEGRDAITTVRASWSDFQQTPSDRRTLEKLAARADKDNDAATLAFVALSVDDPQRFKTLADRAVALNPELVWIYATQVTHILADGNYAAWQERLKRLQASDPSNAVPVLLAADFVVEQSGAADVHRSLEWNEIEPRLAGNPQWMSLMARAFASPRYDGYSRRRYQVTRSVWARDRYLSPAVLIHDSWSEVIPNLRNLRIFSSIRAHQAEKAFAAGDLKEAERLLGEVDSFGERMLNEDSTVLEQLIGLSLERDANRKLAELYTSAGRTADAQRAGSRVEQLEERQAGFRDRARARDARQQAYFRAGILVQGFAILAVLAGFSALAGILLLELWPASYRNRQMSWRRTLCWAADYAPVTSLVAGGALLLSFLPYARAFSEYRTSATGISGQEVFAEALSGFTPWDPGAQAERAIWIWSIVTVTLATLAIFIVGRSIYRARFKPITT